MCDLLLFCVAVCTSFIFEKYINKDYIRFILILIICLLLFVQSKNCLGYFSNDTISMLIDYYIFYSIIKEIKTMWNNYKK